MQHKISAGLLMYRRKNGYPEYFLVHPGGPYLKNKDWGYWGIPKGEVEPSESLLAAAIREFGEETGLPAGEAFIPLGSVVLASGKTVHAWAFEGDWNESVPIRSNLFQMEWPPHSGQLQWFPEVDKAGFFPLETALRKINPGQADLLHRFEAQLKR